MVQSQVLHRQPFCSVAQAHDTGKPQPDPHRERLTRIAEIRAIHRSIQDSASMREPINLVAHGLNS